ncbi:MAG: hypothetical protein K2X01_11815 [Cyanobacteria bacterium]|nr:hypothetical protein [Cyanobacteriota bacterium]
MSLLTNIANLMAKPDLSRATTAMTKMTNASPTNVLPTVIVETAVTGGRSAYGWKRSGFLEFQERLWEESVAAAFWIWGVSWMEKLYDKVISAKGRSPEMSRIQPEKLSWAWNRQKSLAAELTPMERYTRDALQAGKIMGGNFRRLLFSVGSAILVVAFVIPWLNKAKTNWIISKFYKKTEPSQPPQTSSRGHSAPSLHKTFVPRDPVLRTALPPVRLPQRQPQANALIPPFRPHTNPMPPAPFLLPTTPAQSLGQYPPPYFNQPGYFQNPAYPIHYPQQFTQARPIQNYRQVYGPQFGLSPRLAATVMDRVGHAIQDTDLGRLLVIDTGIIGGRAISYGKRSPYEAIEVVARDGISLYLYFLARPHMVAIANKIMNPAFNIASLLDPSVSEVLNARLQKDLASHSTVLTKNSSITVSEVQAIEEVLLGKATPAIQQLEVPLADSMRSASLLGNKTRVGFLPLLEKELLVLEPAQAKMALKSVQAYLKSRYPAATQLTADQLVDMLEAMRAQTHQFSSWVGQLESANVVTATKQAFRHTVGLDVSQWGLLLKNSQIPIGDLKALNERFQSARILDRWDGINAMYRRILNLAPAAGANPHAAQVLETAETIAAAIEKAATHSLPLEEVFKTPVLEWLQAHQGAVISVDKTLKASITALERYLKGQGTLTSSHMRQLAALPQSMKGLKPMLSELLAVTSPGKTLPQSVQTGVLNAAQQVAKISRGHITPASLQLLEFYGNLMGRELQSTGGRVFSLVAGERPQELLYRIDEILKGGTLRDRTLLKQALKTTLALGDDARGAVNPTKVAAMREAIQDYGQTMIRSLNKAVERGEQRSLSTLLSAFKRASHTGFFVTQVLGFGAAMVGLGIIVPQIQNFITRKLTGQNVHPGLAAITSNQGLTLKHAE